MTTSQQLGERTANGRSPGPASDRRAVLDQARTTVLRATALVAAQQEALDALQAARSAHDRLRRGGDGPAMGDHDERTSGEPVASLTPRQLEILRYLAEGHNTRQIAERLWLSRATVRNHVSGIFAALDCHSRLEAVAKARARRLI